MPTVYTPSSYHVDMIHVPTYIFITSSYPFSLYPKPKVTHIYAHSLYQNKFVQRVLFRPQPPPPSSKQRKEQNIFLYLYIFLYTLLFFNGSGR